MIMEANIGIGIYGEEGMSAVQASDFSIGEFKLLKRLLFIHGRINLYRISKMILYFFLKNFVFTMSQFYFAFLCLASGQTFVDDWYITCYNLIFTAFPLCVSALTDSDIDLYDNKITKKNLALLYKESRDTYKIFSFLRFIWTLSKGTLYSLIIFIESCVRQILVKNGYFTNIWHLSLKNYICVLSVVSLNLLINSSFIVIYLPLSIIITTFLLFIGFLFINHYGILFSFNSKASIGPSLEAPSLYLSIFLISILSFILDYSFKLVNLFYNKKLTYKIILKKSLKKRKEKKNSLIISNMNNVSSKSLSNRNNLISKSYSSNHKKPMKRHIIRSSLNNQEFSNNRMIINTSNYILNNINKNYTFKQGSSNQYRNSNDASNNIFSLKFRGINNIK
jgi:magnesium-transporting ATPase (P-type)